jgi:hypothetical protein
MNYSEQSLSEERRQHIEAILARHLQQLFQRLPMLSGFWRSRAHMRLRRFIVDVLTCVALLVMAFGAVGPDVDVPYALLIAGALLGVGLMLEPLVTEQETDTGQRLMRWRTFACAVH